MMNIKTIGFMVSAFLDTIPFYIGTKHLSWYLKIDLRKEFVKEGKSDEKIND
ncbi:hypothetical protein ES705_27969 [subsurface metagenome]